MGSGKVNNVPSEEDFLRARALMRERDRGLEAIRSKMLDLFGGDGLHEAFVFFSKNTNSFIVRLFFRWNHQLLRSKDQIYVDSIRGAVSEVIKEIGRKDLESAEIVLEFDSHENVETRFGGDYNKALR